MSSRPLSPHLTIYRPQISSVLSIMHRMTGVALFFAALLLVAWLSIAAFAPGFYSSFYDAMNSVLGRIALVGFTFAFFYHFCNGIRHLFWDMGKGFALKTMTRSGLAVVFFALVLTLAAWCPAMMEGN